MTGLTRLSGWLLNLFHTWLGEEFSQTFLVGSPLPKTPTDSMPPSHATLLLRTRISFLSMPSTAFWTDCCLINVFLWSGTFRLSRLLSQEAVPWSRSKQGTTQNSVWTLFLPVASLRQAPLGSHGNPFLSRSCWSLWPWSPVIFVAP